MKWLTKLQTTNDVLVMNWWGKLVGGRFELLRMAGWSEETILWRNIRENELPSWIRCSAAWKRSPDILQPSTFSFPHLIRAPRSYFRSSKWKKSKYFCISPDVGRFYTFSNFKCPKLRCYMAEKISLNILTNHFTNFQLSTPNSSSINRIPSFLVKQSTSRSRISISVRMWITFSLFPASNARKCNVQ